MEPTAVLKRALFPHFKTVIITTKSSIVYFRLGSDFSFLFLCNIPFYCADLLLYDRSQQIRVCRIILIIGLSIERRRLLNRFIGEVMRWERDRKGSVARLGCEEKPLREREWSRLRRQPSLSLIPGFEPQPNHRLPTPRSPAHGTCPGSPENPESDARDHGVYMPEHELVLSCLNLFQKKPPADLNCCQIFF